MFSYLFTFNFDIVNKSNISNTVLLKSPCIVMGPLDAHVSSYRVWNEKKEQSNILICQIIFPFIIFFVKISYSYHKGNKKPGHDAVCIIITHNVTLNVITTKARSRICVWLFFLSDSATVVYRIRVYKTPAAYKKIKGLGWWLIEIWLKFFQFLLKKAPKTGLLGKKVAVYLNFNWIF